MSAQSFGLCDRCVSQRVVRSGRGSAFSLCTVGLRDPDWPKYPATPVRSCPRFEPRDGAEADAGR